MRLYLAFLILFCLQQPLLAQHQNRLPSEKQHDVGTREILKIKSEKILVDIGGRITQRMQNTTVFTAPDTVCVNSPVPIKNTSVGASNFYWNFCVANASTNPVGTNLGNYGFSLAVFVDYAKDGDNYYAFVTNNMPGRLIRLDFGKSLLNTPTARDFGNMGGVIPDYCEGIQLVKNEGRWYAIIVGNKPIGRIVKIDFGPSLSNNTPTATNWGNIGDLAFPTDLHLFQNGSEWFGLTINAETNSITRFNFTNSFANTPTGVNLGNIGSLSYPTGIFAISKNGTWHAFVTNAGSGVAHSTNASLTRLDFGNSLLNTPTGTNLGNPGNTLSSARDITIYQSCDEIFGFVVNNSIGSDIVKLNFNNTLTSTPLAVSIGNTGRLSFPHGISKLFRVENDLYSFVTNVNNNSITRLKFEGCNTSSLAYSNLENPPAITYQNPGTYNISLVTDEGLPTQNSFCKQVVVLQNLELAPVIKTICEGDSILLSASTSVGYLWNNGSTAQSIYAKQTGKYWVRSSNGGGCIQVDSFDVKVTPIPVVNIGKDTSFCADRSIVLDAENTGANYLWNNGHQGQSLTVQQEGIYSVIVTKSGCSKSDTITIKTLPVPNITITGSNNICEGNSSSLTAAGGNTYSWLPAHGLSNSSGAITSASPTQTTNYVVSGTGVNGCKSEANFLLTVTPKPVFSVSASKAILCIGDTVTLAATGGDSYEWSPLGFINEPYSNQTKAFPVNSATYKVVINDSRCDVKDSLFVSVPVVTKPSVQTVKSNDINCFLSQATLTASGGSKYLWQPSGGLSDPLSNKPVAKINATTTYHVLITTNEGCEVEDSITVFVNKGDDGSGYPVPNAFTPNNDGKNDCFGVRWWGDVTKFSMQLFNRWGEIVFKTEDPTVCWDGYYKGQLQPKEVFIYLITANGLCGKIQRKGTFTLIR